MGRTDGYRGSRPHAVLSRLPRPLPGRDRSLPAGRCPARARTRLVRGRRPDPSGPRPRCARGFRAARSAGGCGSWRPAAPRPPAGTQRRLASGPSSPGRHPAVRLRAAGHVVCPALGDPASLGHRPGGRTHHPVGCDGVARWSPDRPRPRSIRAAGRVGACLADDHGRRLPSGRCRRRTRGWQDAQRRPQEGGPVARPRGGTPVMRLQSVMKRTRSNPVAMPTSLRLSTARILRTFMPRDWPTMR